ncbi:unnamed protein product [Phytophthora fragariaefolia]|uniref:Unnamed protein product n=1 Tax=Phytophthora fragariaefolia TaxID=1490495 RepID=A0A9W6YC57_9STRA|nr:unnamed protein product [Phytophthora fragariaefolia]
MRGQTKTTERRLTEEGGETRDEAQTEEGGTSLATREKLIDDALNDETMMSLGRMSDARKVTKQAKKASKRMRAEQARHRCTDTEPADTVESAVATLDAETQAKRRQQVGNARAELARRRADGAEPGVQRAQVRLAQRTDGGVALAMTATRPRNDDGPTTDVTVVMSATMYVGNERLDVKLDSGARYSVAGTDWMVRGKRLKKPAPVDFVEGIGGFLLDVIGVWAFHMRNAFDQLVEVFACIVDGCTDEFLIGVDFRRQHQANIDFARNEVRYSEKGTKVVLPFRTENEGSAKVAAVRLARRTQLTQSSVTPISVAVVAPDGETGVFLPTQHCGAVVLAAAATSVRNGQVLVPAINVYERV